MKKLAVALAALALILLGFEVAQAQAQRAKEDVNRQDVDSSTASPPTRTPVMADGPPSPR
jgi:hypothetical protein